jgi:FdhD protein
MAHAGPRLGKRNDTTHHVCRESQVLCEPVVYVREPRPTKILSSTPHCSHPSARLSCEMAVQTSTSSEGVAQVSILKYSGNLTSGRMARDDLTVEEPLEIIVKFRRGSNLVTKPLSITMRTPGSDRALAVGFLFTEGILHELSMLSSVDQNAENSVIVSLNEEVNLQRLERHFYTTSSCGVCGKTSLEALRINREIYLNSLSPKVSPQLLLTLPQILARYQSEFSRTGGIHASAIFDTRGHLCAISEDVGRHNALDRLIGNELLAGRTDFSDLVLLVSGRASFELVQKSLMAGIPIMAAVGAPSSLAVDLAQRYGMTLVGFLRDNRFNLYSGAARVG